MSFVAKSPAGIELPWDRVETVMLDMDGTVLDLAFDNHFWMDFVPRTWGEARGLSYEEAFAALEPSFRLHAGTLNWYCMDFWSEELGLDIHGMKREMQAHVRYLPDAEVFLQRLAGLGKQTLLVTNAHHGALEIKLARTGLDRYLDGVHTSHDLGVPKEDRTFWMRLSQRESFRPEATLFVDDSLPVLKAAKAFGIRYLFTPRTPDSTRGPRDGLDGYQVLESLLDLLPAT